jgi:hypothetical protein
MVIAPVSAGDGGILPMKSRRPLADWLLDAHYVKQQNWWAL